ncbi:PatB family C-S lyase [Pelosinus sp. IPA-1]|uniref:MalY/PatB family protein n=1 Tax=Pelosinus sp. IPA-1 TaxID=3029569 RepID=UPI00243624CA|nr:PatB family C-S lyase [Pelosinus sp. IPA-1]GMB00525.1 aminotransferase [Pelosinus sp. IPA-1]
MRYDFDTVLDRSSNFAAKYDELGKKFGKDDLIALWVADMDFKVANPIIEAIQSRAAQGIFGYTSRPDSYFQAIQQWLKNKHEWTTDTQLMIHCPGVVPSLSLLIQHFTQPGDNIIIQPPVYYPFFDVVKNNGRTLLENPLKLVNGQYEMDYDHLESLAKNGAKMLLLCSPHNPIGRVWRKDELVRLGEICLAHGIVVIADEIHSDLVFSGHKHTPFAMISEEFRKNTYTCLAPSKTFNLAGLQASITIFPNASDRNKFDEILGNLDIRRNNCFSLVASEAAYRYGDEWLQQVKEYIEGNFAFLQDFCKKNIPQIHPNFPEGTYLVWIDCRELGMDKDELHNFMINEAKLALDDGYWFGDAYAGYMRLNAACPRSIITQALKRWQNAIEKRIR